ncbi:MAG: MEDS domain-containing protein [Desulfatibacillaceae bacterium]
MHIRTSFQSALHLGFGEWTCNWGVHIAGLYETPKDRDEILMGYLHRGDLEGDLQFYCPCERSAAEFRRGYLERYPGRAASLDDPERFRIESARDLYCPDGAFSPWDMEDGLNEFYRQSRENGAPNIRATAEMAWALEAIPGVEHLMAYESRLNYFIPDKPWISICLYNVSRFSGATIMNVLRTHPYTISGGMVMENPYYQDPDVWLAQNAPDFLRMQRVR